MCFAGARTLSHMAATGSGYSSFFLPPSRRSTKRRASEASCGPTGRRIPFAFAKRSLVLQRSPSSDRSSELTEPEEVAKYFFTKQTQFILDSPTLFWVCLKFRHELGTQAVPLIRAEWVPVVRSVFPFRGERLDSISSQTLGMTRSGVGRGSAILHRSPTSGSAAAGRDAVGRSLRRCARAAGRCAFASRRGHENTARASSRRAHCWCRWWRKGGRPHPSTS